MEKEQVNHPAHYNQGKIECIDAMISAKGILNTIIFCDLSTFKYEWRLGHKDDNIQEINKQIWYLNKQKELREKIINNPKALELVSKIDKLANELNNLF